MDYLLSLPSAKHNNGYIFVVVEIFSKMAILVDFKKIAITKDATKLFIE